VPDSPRVVNEKATLRTSVLATRAARSPQDRAAAAAAVAGTVADRLAAARIVAAYVPTPEEPGHGRLVEALTGAMAARGGRLLLPVVPAEGRDLAWAEHDGVLVPGRFGLLEPAGQRLPGPALRWADAVVVPALAVGRDGSRLGRGGGYYDRALASARSDAVLVAVLFDGEVLDAVPAGEHDRRVGAVVTPSGGWQELAAPA
jgi:5-formyltetrahydrofolate cyclo-ligase